MRFYYFYPATKGMNHGHGKKILGQCSYLIKNGLEVNLVLIVGKEFEDLNQKFVKVMYYIDGSNFVSKIRRQWQLREILINLIESANPADIIYLRYPHPLFCMLWPFFLGRKRKCKIINEHNTIEHEEFRLVGSSLSLIVDFVIGNLVRRKVDAIVGVTNEITSYEVMRSGDHKKPHITIGNGIEVNGVNLRSPPSFAGTEVNILCVASFISRWHGFDRLLRGLALYRGSANVHIFIVGQGPELLNLKRIVGELLLDSNVSFTGFIEGVSLDNFFDICHIAIGSLGMHRKGLSMTSELKIRDYTARGIPIVCGAVDPDFPHDCRFIHIVPADESPIDFEKIISFAEEIYLDNEHHIKMRAFAEHKLDWSVKMKELTEFCEALIEE